MGIICNKTKQSTKPGYQRTTNTVFVEINKNYTLPNKENDNNKDNNYRCENADEAPIVTDDTSGCDNYILAGIEINGILNHALVPFISVPMKSTNIKSNILARYI